MAKNRYTKTASALVQKPRLRDKVISMIHVVRWRAATQLLFVALLSFFFNAAAPRTLRSVAELADFRPMKRISKQFVESSGRGSAVGELAAMSHRDDAQVTALCHSPAELRPNPALFDRGKRIGGVKIEPQRYPRVDLIDVLAAGPT